MKIGILTASRTNNNGTDLQAFAMQTLFSKVNPDTEVIDYVCEKLERSHLIFPSFNLRNILFIPIKLINNINHNNFRKKYVIRSKKLYSKENLSQNDYDAIVVGSDQIWNLNITGNDLSFFLPFKSKAKKYSYAASLGKTDIREWNDKFNLKKLLDDFSGVSVREKSGIDALSQMGISAKHDLDPILCLEKEDWRKIPCKGKRKKRYVLLYMVEKNEEAIEYAIRYARENSCQVISVNQGIRSIKKVKSKRFLSVTGWMDYMRDAELIITNSYHGLSFAIAQEKNFRLFMLRENPQSNTRMQSLVETLGLTECVASENVVKNIEIDWKSVEEKLKKEREASKEYIKKIAELA